MRRAAVAWWFAGAALLMPGCDEEVWVEPTARKVAFDLSKATFTADRRFLCALADGSSVEWMERVKSAGDGRYSVDLLTRNGKSRNQIVDPAELVDFDRLAAQLATGGGARVLFQRDPVPDDLDRMVGNYWTTLIELGRKPITAKGEPALTYLIEPYVTDRPFYVLVASTRKGREGFPIACSEYTRAADGSTKLASQMEVVSLEWGVPRQFVPAPSPIKSRTSFATVDLASAQAAAVGVSLVLPADDGLPAGFSLVLAEEVVMSSTANTAGVERDVTLWRFVYSDGVEHIDLIEHAPLDTMPANFVSNPYFDVAFVSRFGSISSASLLHQGTQVEIESRISTARFEALLQALVKI